MNPLPPADPIIAVTGLTYSYPGFPTPALRDLSLQVFPGEICAVVGASGAGKSTLCYALAGFIPHFFHGSLRGSVRVAGCEVPASSLGDLAGQIGLVVQNPFNQITGARFTVAEEVAFALENLGLPRADILDRVDHALAVTGLLARREASPFALSGGQAQRLALAAILAMRPRVLILDEPTSQLDPVGVRDILTALSRLAAEGGATIILVEHKLEAIAAVAGRVIALEAGRIVADGPPRQVLADPLMEEIGVGATRFTRAARLARQQGRVDPARPLPVTLDQAVEFFS